MTKEEVKKKEAEEKHKEEYRRKQQEIEKLQRENLQAMYPEYYQQHQQNEGQDKDDIVE